MLWLDSFINIISYVGYRVLHYSLVITVNIYFKGFSHSTSASNRRLSIVGINSSPQDHDSLNSKCDPDNVATVVNR